MFTGLTPDTFYKMFTGLTPMVWIFVVNYVLSASHDEIEVIGMMYGLLMVKCMHDTPEHEGVGVRGVL